MLAELNHPSCAPESRVYRAYWQDGSLDLFAGLAAAVIGIAWIFDLVALGPLAPVVAIPAWSVFRKQVVEPRLGYVRFDEKRRSRMRRAHVSLIALGCGALLLGLATYFFVRTDHSDQDWVGATVPALPGVLVGIAAALSAWMFSIPRLALYSMPFVVAGLVVAILGADPGWALLLGGLVSALCGGALVVRFVRQFPLLPGDLD